MGLVNAVLSLGLNFDLWLLWLWAAGRQGRRGEHWHRRLQNASSSGRGVRKGRQRGRIGVDEIEQPDGVSGGEVGPWQAMWYGLFELMGGKASGLVFASLERAGSAGTTCKRSWWLWDCSASCCELALDHFGMLADRPSVCRSRAASTRMARGARINPSAFK